MSIMVVVRCVINHTWASSYSQLNKCTSSEGNADCHIITTAIKNGSTFFFGTKKRLNFWECGIYVFLNKNSKIYLVDYHYLYKHHHQITKACFNSEWLICTKSSYWPPKILLITLKGKRLCYLYRKLKYRSDELQPKKIYLLYMSNFVDSI